MARPMRRRLRLGVLLTALFGSIALACTLASSIATRELLGRDSPFIAFDATPGHRGELFLVNTDGLVYTAAPLSHTPASECCPVWSPDGTRIAYISFPFGNNRADINLAAVESTNVIAVRQLTTAPGDDRYPTWSPDSTQIAFQSDRDGNLEIYVLTLNYIEPISLKRLTYSGDAEVTPAWSPTGDKIAFVSNRGWAPEIYIMSPQGSDQTRVTDHSVMWLSPPSWSPDGTRLVFTGLRDDNR